MAGRVVLLILLATLSVGRSRSGATPLEKVLVLLRKMEAKAKEATQAEAAQWAGYKQWCGDAEAEKQDIVKKSDLRIGSLKSEVERLEADISRAEAEIASKQADVADRDAGLKKASETRTKEREEYTVLRQDLTESVHALVEAIRVLKDQDYSRAPVDPANAASLLQSLGSSSAADALLASVGASPGEANAYEFQSGGVVALLDKLLDDFRARLTNREKEAMSQQHSYEMLAQDLTAEMRLLRHDVGKWQKRAEEGRELKSEAAAQLAAVSDARAQDAAFLQELGASCRQKSGDFEARAKLRAEEVDVLGKAIELLSGAAVAGAAEKHLPLLVQHSVRGTSLLQVRRGAGQPGDRGRAGGRRTATAAFLRNAGQRLGSPVLAALASRVSVIEDPFVKVKQLIQQLIDRLKAEAAEEAEHKAWCDGELAANSQTRSAKTEEVEGLRSTINRVEGEAAALRRDVAALSKAAAELRAEMARLAKFRNDDRVRSEETIADATGAQMALADAMAMLRKFYGEAQKAVALQQEPPIFEDAYQGQQVESKNVIAFLEVLHSDFVRLEQETTKAEGNAKQEYESMVDTSNKDLEEKKALVDQKNSDLNSKEEDLTTARNDLEFAQGELDTATAYYGKLRPSCMAATDAASAAVGSAERIRRRHEEIASLREALEILSGETVPDVAEGLRSSVDGGNYGMDVQPA